MREKLRNRPNAAGPSAGEPARRLEHANQSRHRSNEARKTSLGARWPCGWLPRSRVSRPNRRCRASVSANLEAAIDIDPLTETLNRRGFERELKRSLAYVKRYGATAALIYLDLDDFKPVNDRHGHAAGDAVLKAIAAALRSARARVRRRSAHRRRRIAVLLWNISSADARAKAAALEAAALRDAGRLGESTLAVGASAG